jgi:hypothetical protein
VTGLSEGSNVLSQENVPVFSNNANYANYADVAKLISNMTEAQRDDVLKNQSDNPVVLSAIGLYGDVAQREAAIQLLEERIAGFKKERDNLFASFMELKKDLEEQAKNNPNAEPQDFNKNPVFLALMEREKEISELEAGYAESYKRVNYNSWDKFAKVSEAEFRQAFAQMWYVGGVYGQGLSVSGGLKNPGWAMMHQYLSQVGPNAEVPYKNDFWADGIKPPPLNPKVLAMFQRMYEDTQKELANEPDTIKLWRNTAQPYGLAAESWADRDIGWIMPYSGANRQFEKRVVEIPKKYVILTHKTAEKVTGRMIENAESEYTVLGSAALYNSNPTEYENRPPGLSRDRSY